MADRWKVQKTAASAEISKWQPSRNELMVLEAGISSETDPDRLDSVATQLSTSCAYLGRPNRR